MKLNARNRCTLFCRKADMDWKYKKWLIAALACLVLKMGCNQAGEKKDVNVPSPQDPYQNQETGFKSWTPESIKVTFPLVEQKGTFILRSHSNHLPRLNFGCQMAGCHVNAKKGMEGDDIPPMPSSCYECHDTVSKLPVRIPE